MLRIQKHIYILALTLSCNSTHIAKSQITEAKNSGFFSVIYDFISQKCQKAVCIIKGTYYEIPVIEKAPASAIATKSNEPSKPKKRKKKKKAKKAKSIEAHHENGIIESFNLSEYTQKKPTVIVTSSIVDTAQNLVFGSISESIAEDENGFQAVISPKRDITQLKTVEKIIIDREAIRGNGIFQNGDLREIGDKKYYVSLVNNEGTSSPSHRANFTLSFIEEESAEFISTADNRSGHIKINDPSRPHISVSLSNYSDQKFHITTNIDDETTHFYFFLDTGKADHKTQELMDNLYTYGSNERRHLVTEIENLGEAFSKVAKYSCH